MGRKETERNRIRDGRGKEREGTRSRRGLRKGECEFKRTSWPWQQQPVARKKRKQKWVLVNIWSLPSLSLNVFSGDWDSLGPNVCVAS